MSLLFSTCFKSAKSISACSDPRFSHCYTHRIRLRSCQPKKSLQYILYITNDIHSPFVLNTTKKFTTERIPTQEPVQKGTETNDATQASCRSSTSNLEHVLPRLEGYRRIDHRLPLRLLSVFDTLQRTTSPTFQASSRGSFAGIDGLYRIHRP